MGGGRLRWQEIQSCVQSAGVGAAAAAAIATAGARAWVSSLGAAKSSRWVMLRARWVPLRALAG
jgi:hypothetical protein